MEGLKALCLEEFDLLSSCGFIKPCTAITLEDKNSLVCSISLHYVIGAVKAEIDQFTSGLECFDVLPTLKKSPGVLKDFFCIKTTKVTSGELS